MIHLFIFIILFLRNSVQQLNFFKKFYLVLLLFLALYGVTCIWDYLFLLRLFKNFFENKVIFNFGFLCKNNVFYTSFYIFVILVWKMYLSLLLICVKYWSKNMIGWLISMWEYVGCLYMWMCNVFAHNNGIIPMSQLFFVYYDILLLK